MTHWPVKYCPGRFLVYSSDIIKDLLAAVSFTSFLWLDDVCVTGLLASKVGNVKHLLFQDVSMLIERSENAKTAQFLKAWNRFLHLETLIACNYLNIRKSKCKDLAYFFINS